MPQKKRGRPTKYTEELGLEIVKVLTTGVSMYDAARFCGVTVDEAKHWLDQNSEFRLKCNKAKAQKTILAARQEYELIQNGDQKTIISFLNREERKRQNRENIKLKRLEAEQKAIEENGVISLSPIDLNDWAAEQDAAFMGREILEGEKETLKGEKNCSDSSDT